MLYRMLPVCLAFVLNTNVRTGIDPPSLRQYVWRQGGYLAQHCRPHSTVSPCLVVTNVFRVV